MSAMLCSPFPMRWRTPVQRKCSSSSVPCCERNWLHTEEWVACHKSRHFTLDEQTNNRLESLNGKIKYVCAQYSSLDKFFTDVFCVLRMLRDERSHVSVIARISRMASLAPALEEEAQLYRNILMAYACRVVVEQLAKRAMISFPANIAPFMSSEGLLDVTGNSWLARHLQAVTEASSDVAIQQLLPGPGPVTLSSHQKYRQMSPI